MNTTQVSDIFFPVKPSLPSEAHNSDEIVKLQQEMEEYLHFVEKIVHRAIEGKLLAKVVFFVLSMSFIK